MANSVIKSYKFDDIKSRLLSPAQTSHYQVWTPAKEEVTKFINARNSAGIGNGIIDTENISLSCCDASLPGSTFQTHDLMAYAGVNERFAYMRAYDDRSDFTFYVNEQYDQLFYFEGWSAYIADEQYNKNTRGGGIDSPTYSYRMNFPNNYRSDITISKFERSFGGENGKPGPKSKTLKYVFKDAYPISIASIPVSYNSSELLKCTVSFTYSRFYLRTDALGGVSTNPESKPTPSPQAPGPTTSATRPNSFIETPFEERNNFNELA
jgi:hypothetical protein